MCSSFQRCMNTLVTLFKSAFRNYCMLIRFMEKFLINCQETKVPFQKELLPYCFFELNISQIECCSFVQRDVLFVEWDFFCISICISAVYLNIESPASLFYEKSTKRCFIQLRNSHHFLKLHTSIKSHRLDSVTSCSVFIKV